MRAFLIFLLSFVALFAFFYFFPAYIFESKVIGNESELVVDLSLKNILFSDDMPAELNPKNIKSIRPTTSGYMILFICLIALPVMIAYRSTISKKLKETKNE